MSDIFDDGYDDDEEPYGFYEGQCCSCDLYTHVNDLMLCQECNAKLDRDLMRQRAWDYSATAFDLTIEGREEVRRLIIKQYGKQLELLAPSSKSKKKRKQGKNR